MEALTASSKALYLQKEAETLPELKPSPNDQNLVDPFPGLLKLGALRSGSGVSTQVSINPVPLKLQRQSPNPEAASPR